MKKVTRYLLLPSVLMVLSINSAVAYGPFYLSLGVGNSNFQLNEAGIVASFSALTSSSEINDSATAFSLYGAMQMDEFLSLEADLLIAGDITATEAGQVIKLFDVTTLALTLALSKQFGERTRLFTRAGVHFWDVAESFGDLNTIDNATDITYGIGMDINLYGDRSRQFRIQWNHYEYDGVFIKDSDTLSLNLLFMFGGE